MRFANHKGTAVKMPNGLVVSIQHSDHHYCGTDTVEVAVIRKGKFLENFPHEEHGIASFVTAPQLLEILIWARDHA